MSVHLLRGKDEAVLATRTLELLAELVGTGDRALMVDEFAGEDVDLAAALAAARTPPFLTERRVVVIRDLEARNAEELRALAAALADPLDTTDLVLVLAGAAPKPLVDAVKKAGGQLRDTDPPSRARDRRQWFDEQLAARDVRMDAAAVAAVLDRLGEDVGRLSSLLAMLDATFGPGRRLGPEDVVPFLGEAGSVPPWELTDAIDAGATTEALVALRRMMRAGERHPLQLMAVLHGHYTRMLRLDGAGIADERAAAEAIGAAPFQAKKALDQLRRVGHDGLVRAFEILAAADLDLRGMRDLPAELVMEVAVARLSRLAPSSRAALRR